MVFPVPLLRIARWIFSTILWYNFLRRLGNELSRYVTRAARISFECFKFNRLPSVYGKIKTMRKVMDKSVEDKMPQFYLVFRDGKLIEYMFLIGDNKMFRAFPWLAIDNLELPSQ